MFLCFIEDNGLRSFSWDSIRSDPGGAVVLSPGSRQRMDEGRLSWENRNGNTCSEQWFQGDVHSPGHVLCPVHSDQLCSGVWITLHVF